MPMQPERLAQEPLRPAAHHSAAHLPAYDDADARGRVTRQSHPVGDQTAQDGALARLTDARKIPALLEAQVAPQTAACWQGVRHGASPSNRGESLASHAAPISQSGPSALGAFAGQKPVLPLAADFRWLILAFHNSIARSQAGLPVPSDATRGIVPLTGARENNNERSCVKRGQCARFAVLRSRLPETVPCGAGVRIPPPARQLAVNLLPDPARLRLSS